MRSMMLGELLVKAKGNNGYVSEKDIEKHDNCARVQYEKFMNEPPKI